MTMQGTFALIYKQILELEQKLEEVKDTKNTVVKKQKYEEAAKLRDDEKRLEKELAIAQEKWCYYGVWTHALRGTKVT